MNVNSLIFGISETSLPKSSSLEEKLKAAAALGFSFVELVIGPDNSDIQRLDWSPEEIASLRLAQAKNEIAVNSMRLEALRRFPLGHSDPKRRALGMELLRRAVLFASRAGIGIIRLPDCVTSGEERSQASDALYLQNICAAVSYAAQGRCLLACPISGGEGFFDPERFSKLRDICASHWLAAALDTAELFREITSRTGRTQAIMTVYRELVSLESGDLDAEGRVCVPGEGSTDIFRVFECMKALNYSGAYLINYPHESCPEDIRRGQEHIKALMSQAGFFGSVGSSSLSAPFIKIQR